MNHKIQPIIIVSCFDSHKSNPSNANKDNLNSEI
jgi:hypothetical protein